MIQRKVHKDCPFTQEQIDEWHSQLLHVATTNNLPARNKSWFIGHQNHYSRIMENESLRHERLKRLTATALGLYMRERISGRMADVQLKRLKMLQKEIEKYGDNTDIIDNVTNENVCE